METLTRPLRATARMMITHCALGALCLGLIPGVSTAAETDSLEFPVKAAYLTKFGIYVEWPANAFASASSALTLCIVGDDPFGATLDAAANGQQINGRPLAIKRLKTAARDAGCHILYAGNLEQPRAAQIIDSLRGANVLTVSDGRNGTTGAGIIHFVIKDNRVRFNIDEDAAVQSGLIISSKLLGLALSVKPRQTKEGR